MALKGRMERRGKEGLWWHGWDGQGLRQWSDWKQEIEEGSGITLCYLGGNSLGQERRGGGEITTGDGCCDVDY